MADYNNSWYSQKGSLDDIVLYTKTSISRNISGFLFPNKMSYESSSEVLSLIFSYMNELPSASNFTAIKFKDIDPLGLKLLEERGVLASKNIKTVEKGLVVHNNGSLYVNINTEDHLNILSFQPGLDIDGSYFVADNLESEMQKKILFVAKKDIGYINSNLMSIGSGVKFSVLFSLPGILYSNKISLVAEIVRDAGLIISGYYSEDSKDSLGALFSVASGACAGGNVESQIQLFYKTIDKIIEMEKEFRKEYIKNNLIKVEDMVARAFAISQNAKMMSYKEAVGIIFKIKFALNLAMIEGVTHEQCNSLLFNTQVGHLASFILNGHLNNEYSALTELSELSLEEYRASIMQKEFKDIKIKF